MAEHNNLYSRARYYDIVFKRDVGREIDFLQAVFRRHRGRDPESALEVACGPGYHARAFARRGLAAHGLDLRPEMIEFARDEAAREGVAVNWLVADMRDFALPGPVDLAVSPFDAVDCLASLDDFTAHFRAVAANLTAGGLYVIEQSHLRDTNMGRYGEFHYRGERDGCTVVIDWATDLTVDSLAQRASVGVTMRVNDNGVEQVFIDRADEFFLTPQLLAAVARLSGALEVMDWYGDFSLAQPYDDTPASRRWITVLRKLP